MPKRPPTIDPSDKEVQSPSAAGDQAASSSSSTVAAAAAAVVVESPPPAAHQRPGEPINASANALLVTGRVIISHCVLTQFSFSFLFFFAFFVVFSFSSNDSINELSRGRVQSVFPRFECLC